MSFGQYLSFEYLDIVLKDAPRILFIIIHRPPKYSPAFVEEFTELLSMTSSEFDCLLLQEIGTFTLIMQKSKLQNQL